MLLSLECTIKVVQFYFQTVKTIVKEGFGCFPAGTIWKIRLFFTALMIPVIHPRAVIVPHKTFTHPALYCFPFLLLTSLCLWKPKLSNLDCLLNKNSVTGVHHVLGALHNVVSFAWKIKIGGYFPLMLRKHFTGFLQSLEEIVLDFCSLDGGNFLV